MQSQARTAKSALTLVETAAIVVVGLLALAVLAPAAHNTRAGSQLTGCRANMRAIGQASRAYAAEDPNEILIPVPVTNVLHRASGAVKWGGRAGKGQSNVPSDPTFSEFGTTSYRGPAHRPLNRQLYKAGFVDYNPVDGMPNPGPGNVNWLKDTKLDLDVYCCPADTGYAGGGFMYTASARGDRNERVFAQEGLSAYDHYGTSYVANVFWFIGGLAGQPLRSQSVYLTPLSRVPNPARSVAYQEVPSRWTWLWGSWSGSGCEWVWPGRVANAFNTVPGWHGEPFRFNVTFADGHAAFIEMQGCMRPPPNLGAPNYPTGECGSLTPPYECERCVTICGPEWQLDTLPAPSVLTMYFAD